LYRRRERPPDGVTADAFPDLAQALTSMASETDAVVVIPPNLLPLLGQQVEGDLDVYALPGEDPASQLVEEAATSHDRVWAIFGEGDGDRADDAGRRWLNEQGYRAWEAWFGPTQLVLYGTPAEPGTPPMQTVGADLGEAITLGSYSLQDDQAKAQELLALTLFWQARGAIDQNYKVFVHLVDREGQLITQRDGEPAGGLRPTSTWAVGETIPDRVGLLLPMDIPPGEADLLVGMYDPTTLERLPVLDASGQVVGDTISLGRVRIQAIGD
jgi:hypothetical protein